VRTGPEQFDIEQREAQVATNPRIKPMRPEEFTDEASTLVEETFAHVDAVDTSDVPEFFAISFKHPGLARAQMQTSIELGQNGFIPPREQELAILRVAWLSRAPFEWGEHVVHAKKRGLSTDEIERVTQGSDATQWSEHDQAIIRAVEELVADHAITTETWTILAKSWSDPQLMELPGLVGHYLATALFQNSIRFNLLEGNTGLRRR
jgi:alkylhydroperoxidase family enzyme